MFYNTGIATYVWVLTNRKPGHRRGKVQLIDGTTWFKPLRKNLGKKNCELGDADIERIVEMFIKFEETEQSRIFEGEGEALASTDAYGFTAVRYESETARSDHEGDIEAFPLWARQGVGLVKRIQPASEIVREIAEDAQRILKRLAVSS
jgi:type I restriction-modification system DNA methylase subunit